MVNALRDLLSLVIKCAANYRVFANVFGCLYGQLGSRGPRFPHGTSRGPHGTLHGSLRGSPR